MTDDRSLERAARSWLETGPTEAPDRAVEAALLRIQTTSQERDWHVPWRNRPMTLTARLVAAAIAIAVVAVGGALVLGPGTGPTVGATASPSTAQPASPPSSPSQAAVASSAPIDYSDIGGRILMEHLGNAPDGSEMPTTDYHPERRRLYWMDPAKMTGATAVEFLPGQPTGKLDADVAKD